MQQQRNTKNRPYRARNEDTYVSAAKKRYTGLSKRVKGLRYLDKEVDRKTQEEIAYAQHDIEMYGFEFFANHYLFEKIDRLEKLLNNITGPLTKH